MKKVHIIGSQMDLGASKRGVNMGPLAIRYGGFVEKVSALGYDVLDKGDIIPNAYSDDNKKMKSCRSINEANEALYHRVTESLKAGALPVILGGDHCVSAGSVMAASGFYGEIGIIWIDAHGDFNNDETSPSGNMHGMPLSAVCGFGPEKMVDFRGAAPFVKTKNVAVVGGRDIDPEERERMKKAGVNVFSISEIDRLGMPEVMRKAVALASDGTKGIHVSFDIDAVTPEEAPGVGTPVHSGLTIRESFFAAEYIAEAGNLLSVDMVEVNPILDVNNKTALLAGELVLSLLGKTVY